MPHAAADCQPSMPAMGDGRSRITLNLRARRAALTDGRSSTLRISLVRPAADRRRFRLPDICTVNSVGMSHTQLLFTCARSAQSSTCNHGVISVISHFALSRLRAANCSFTGPLQACALSLHACDLSLQACDLSLQACDLSCNAPAATASRPGF